jgi:hypothetical protein
MIDIPLSPMAPSTLMLDILFCSVPTSPIYGQLG